MTNILKTLHKKQIISNAKDTPIKVVSKKDTHIILDPRWRKLKGFSLNSTDQPYYLKSRN